MSDFRDLLVRRMVRNLRHALAALNGATRHDGDYPAVRITITDPDTGDVLDAMYLRLLTFTELVDAVRARTTELVRDELRAQTGHDRNTPAASVLRMVPTDPSPTTTEEKRKNR